MLTAFFGMEEEVQLKTREIKLGLPEISEAKFFRLVSKLRKNLFISAIFKVQKLEKNLRNMKDSSCANDLKGLNGHC